MYIIVLETYQYNFVTLDKSKVILVTGRGGL
jgi:hypothetical protein